MKAPIEKVYEISLRVGAAHLTTVIDVLKDSAEIISLMPVQAPPPVVVPGRAMGYANGRRLKGMSGSEAAMKVLSDGMPHTVLAIGEGMAKEGFSPNSASPAISVLVKDGKARKVGHATYQKA